MVKLRLRRRGRKKRPIYDIVAMDSRKRRDGQHLEVVGQYSPVAQPSRIILDQERAMYWLDNGAQPTDTVRHLLSSEGVLLRLHLKRKGKTAVEVETELAAHKAAVEKRVAAVIAKKGQKASKKTLAAAVAAKDVVEAAKAAEIAAKAAAEAAAVEAKAAAKAAAEAPVAETPAE